MTPAARFQLSDGRVVPVPVGGMVGRLPGAALRIDQPTVSEAHALVSLRSGRLVLLGLRGALELDGKRVAEVVLRPGQSIGLGGGIVLQVEAIELPETVLAVDGLGGEPQLLGHQVWSCLPGPQLVVGRQAAALALLLPSDAGWQLQVGDRTRTLSAGDTWTVDGHTLRAVELPVSRASRPRTVGTDAPVSLPLHLEVWRELTRIRTPDGRRLDLVGHPARILRELVLTGEPAHWEELASTIWEGKEVNLRDSWRRQLQVLRRKLRTAGVRTDLVQSMGDGRAMLDLREGDVLDDRTYADGDGPG